MMNFRLKRTTAGLLFLLLPNLECSSFTPISIQQRFIRPTIQQQNQQQQYFKSPCTFRLFASLKPAAQPLLDSGKALARSGELIIELTTDLNLYGGGLSAAGAELRNAGDSLAQAAASCRFKTGLELVSDELRECGLCCIQASDKFKTAAQEAQVDNMSQMSTVIESAIEPIKQCGDFLEAAGAGIMQRSSITSVGANIERAGDSMAIVADAVQILDPSKIDTGVLAGQRLAFAASKLIEAGQELQGTRQQTATDKSWLFN